MVELTAAELMMGRWLESRLGLTPQDEMLDHMSPSVDFARSMVLAKSLVQTRKQIDELETAGVIRIGGCECVVPQSC